MSENEYEAFTIEEIMAMISEDSVESMADQAQGWTNAAEILRLEHENLKTQYDAVLTHWTSGSVQPFREQVDSVLGAIEEAESHARLKAGAWTNIAGHAKQFYENVKTKHTEWEQVKQAGASNVTSATVITEFLQDFDSDVFKDDNKEALNRAEFDRAARNYMNLLAQYAEDEAIKLRTPLPQYEPPEAPPRWDEEYTQSGNATAFGSATSTAVAGPTLQSAVPGVSTPSLPGSTLPSGSVPGGYTPTMPGGAPIGGVSPVGRTPTPPALRPPSGGRSTLPGRPGGTGAPRTPSLPTNRSSTPGRPGGVPGQRGGTPGRPGGAPNQRGGVPGRPGGQSGQRGGTPGRGGSSRNASGGPRGRSGLQRSQMAPVDRRGSVRSSNQVLGQRPTGKQTRSDAKAAGPKARRVQPSVIGRRLGTASEGRMGGLTRRKPADQTGKGYTRSVLGGKNKGKKDDDSFSRTPIVASTVSAAGMVIGARAVASPEDERASRLQSRRARRQKLRSGGDRPTRAVIGNGVHRTDELADAAPTGKESVKTSESLWQAAPVLPGVIGQRQARPEVDHDPGPTPLSALEQPTEQPHTTGPVAFKDRNTRPDAGGWLS